MQLYFKGVLLQCDAPTFSSFDTYEEYSYQVLRVGESRTLVRWLVLWLSLGHADRLPVDLENNVLGGVGLLAPPRHDRVVPLGIIQDYKGVSGGRWP